jgi:hypothetical protein
MVIGACALLVASLALYVSLATRKPWSPAVESAGTFEPTSTSTIRPKLSRSELPPPAAEVPASKPKPRVAYRPNAVVDVPNVGLRNTPDMAMRASSSGLKKGERIEVVQRVSGKGPAWVKIKTKSGRVGWVLASLVREKRVG